VIGYSRQRRVERRSERATLYGRAIAGVEEYLEAPYRIRRRDDTAEARFVITSAISDTKTAISLHQALLEMHAPSAITDGLQQVRRRRPKRGRTTDDRSFEHQARHQGQPGSAWQSLRPNSLGRSPNVLITAMKADLGKLD
jgi:hypothetical protein